MRPMGLMFTLLRTGRSRATELDPAPLPGAITSGRSWIESHAFIAKIRVS